MTFLPISLDLDACGMRAFYYWGVYQGLLQQGYRIDRIYGRSSGAIVGACILCLEPEQVEIVYKCLQNNSHTRTIYIVDNWCEVLRSVLPADASIRCTNRLFVTAAFLGCIPTTTSVFRDNDHLIQTLWYSGALPFVTTWPTVHCTFDGFLVDVLRPAWYCPAGCACTTYHHAIKITAPRHCWPDRVSITTKHPFSVAQAAMDSGSYMGQHLRPRTQTWVHYNLTKPVSLASKLRK